MSKEEKNLRLNCFMDFYRAAVWFYKNPKGSTHWLFFQHGRKLLKQLGDRRLIEKVGKIAQELKITKKKDINLADRILTFGIMLKGSGRGLSQ